MRRYDNETDDDLAPWRGIAAQAWCYEPNTAKELDADLCEAMALLALRQHREEIADLEAKLAEAQAKVEQLLTESGVERLQHTLEVERPRADGEPLLDAADELIEVADLRGDSDLPHPCDDPKLWTARMQDAWSGLREAIDAARKTSEENTK